MTVLRQFTAVGIYADTGQAFVGWYLAFNPAAVRMAAEEESESGTLEVLSIFEGHLTDVGCGLPESGTEAIECL